MATKSTNDMLTNVPAMTALPEVFLCWTTIARLSRNLGPEPIVGKLKYCTAPEVA